MKISDITALGLLLIQTKTTNTKKGIRALKI